MLVGGWWQLRAPAKYPFATGPGSTRCPSIGCQPASQISSHGGASSAQGFRASPALSEELPRPHSAWSYSVLDHRGLGSQAMIYD